MDCSRLCEVGPSLRALSFVLLGLHAQAATRCEGRVIVDLQGVLVPKEYCGIVAQFILAGRARILATDGLRMPAEVEQIVADMQGWVRGRADVEHANATLLQPARHPDAPQLDWIGTTAAAAILGVCDRRVRALCGRLPSAHKVKGNWRVLRDDVVEEAEARAAA